MTLKEKIKEVLRSSVSKYLTERQIYEKLGCKSHFEKETVGKILEEWKESGELMYDRVQKKWTLTEFSDYLRGTIQGSRKGYAFFLPEDGVTEDLFVAPKNLHGALHGDVVLVEERQFHGKKEAVVVKILEHTVKELVGKVEQKGRFAYVVPDDQRFSEKILLTLKYT